MTTNWTICVSIVSMTILDDLELLLSLRNFEDDVSWETDEDESHMNKEQGTLNEEQGNIL